MTTLIDPVIRSLLGADMTGMANTMPSASTKPKGTIVLVVVVLFCLFFVLVSLTQAGANWEEES